MIRIYSRAQVKDRLGNKIIQASPIRQEGHRFWLKQQGHRAHGINVTHILGILKISIIEKLNY